jgi:hypothetical protein
MTDHVGRFPFRGFHGTYALTIKFPSGREATVRADISRQASQITLVADEKVGTLRLQ